MEGRVYWVLVNFGEIEIIKVLQERRGKISTDDKSLNSAPWIYCVRVIGKDFSNVVVIDWELGRDDGSEISWTLLFS